MGNDAAGGIPKDLAQVIDAWEDLPKPVKKAILAILTTSDEFDQGSSQPSI